MKFILALGFFCALTYLASAFGGPQRSVVPEIPPPAIPRRGPPISGPPKQIQGAVRGGTGANGSQRGFMRDMRDLALMGSDVAQDMYIYNQFLGGGAGGAGGRNFARDMFLAKAADLNLAEAMFLRNRGAGGLMPLGLLT